MDLGNAAGIGPYGVLASEYNLMDLFTVLYPQLQEIDFRSGPLRQRIPHGPPSERTRRKDTMDQESKSRPAKESHMGVGIAVGIMLGLAIGVALESIPVGIALGVAIGAAIGTSLDQKRKHSDTADRE
jgi:hypothetical protein